MNGWRPGSRRGWPSGCRDSAGRQRGELALLVATMPGARSANLMDLAAPPPRPAERPDMRYRWIARLPANPRVACDAVMRPFAQEAVRDAGAAGGTVVLILGQSHIPARHQMLMLAVRVGERASPLAWRVRATRRAIGFAERRALLTRVAAWLAAGGRVAVTGDRFYGTPDLIASCRAPGRGWRLRLGQDLLVFEDGGETTLAECFARGEHRLGGIGLAEKRIVTNVAMAHEPGHPEPWIIAPSEAPAVHRAFDYGLRWGIERTFGWLNRCRRLAEDVENLARTALAFLRLAMIRLMLRRLARPSNGK